MKTQENSSQKNKGEDKAKQDKKDVSNVSFGNTKLASELSKVNWGKDILSENIERAFYNIGASFVKLRPYRECLIKATEIFHDANKLLPYSEVSDLKDIFSIALFVRAYGCFFGAVRLSCSCQIPETQVLLRACIENSLYAFYIADNPEHVTVWKERHKSEANKKKCKKVFTIGNIWKSLEVKSKSITKEARKCYEDTIDWGAHPNELSVYSLFEKKQEGSGYSLSIFNRSEALMRHNLYTVLSKVSLVFKIFALIYPSEFKQPNLSMKISNLNKQIEMLFFATSEYYQKTE